MTNFNCNYEKTFPFSDVSVQIALAATTVLTYTVPGDPNIRYRCKFAFPYNANVWVGYNTTPIVPPAGAVTTTANQKVELNPGHFDGEARYVHGGDILSFISDSVVTNAGLTLLKVPSTM